MGWLAKKISQFAIGFKNNQQVTILPKPDPANVEKADKRHSDIENNSPTDQTKSDSSMLLNEDLKDKFIAELIQFYSDYIKLYKVKQKSIAADTGLHFSTINKLLRKSQGEGMVFNRVSAYYLNGMTPLPKNAEDDEFEKDFFILYEKVLISTKSMTDIMHICNLKGITPREYFNLYP